MKIKKKILSVFMTAAALLTFCGCPDNSQPDFTTTAIPFVETAPAARPDGNKTLLKEFPDGTLLYLEDAAEVKDGFAFFDIAFIRPSSGISYNTDSNPELFNKATGLFEGDKVRKNGFMPVTAGCRIASRTPGNINMLEVDEARYTFCLGEDGAEPAANYVKFSGEVSLSGVLVYYARGDDRLTEAGDVEFIPDSSYLDMPLVSPDNEYGTAYVLNEAGEFICDRNYGMYSDAPRLRLGNYSDLVQRLPQLEKILEGGEDYCVKQVKVALTDIVLEWSSGFSDGRCTAELTEVEQTKTLFRILDDGTKIYEEDAEITDKYDAFDTALVRTSTGIFHDSESDPELFDFMYYFDYLGEQAPTEGFFAVKAGDTVGNAKIAEAGLIYEGGFEEERYTGTVNYVSLEGQLELTGILVIGNYIWDEVLMEPVRTIEFYPDSSYEGLPITNRTFRKGGTSCFEMEGGTPSFEAAGGFGDAEAFDIPRGEGEILFALYTDAPSFNLGTPSDYSDNSNIYSVVNDGYDKSVRRVRVILEDVHIEWDSNSTYGSTARIGEIEELQLIGTYKNPVYY